MERRINPAENLIFREGIVFRLVNRFGVANQFVYCNPDLSLSYVEINDGVALVTNKVAIGRFSFELFQEGVLDGGIVDIFETTDL